ncbi:MAG: hypothetical protein AAFQ15_09195 [Pseudomonadota bacterium]
MIPDYLAQGEEARLFPVLATTSKEGRTASIVLSCLALVAPFAEGLLASVNQRVGKRSNVSCYTEIVFKGQRSAPKDRPDGLISITSGSKSWRALVEAKVANAVIDADQVEKYRQLAKEHSCDCVITISNQFATRPDHHPDMDVRKSRSKIPVYHWSWMHVLTQCDLLLSNAAIADREQTLLLSELRRFLSHESAGVRGFDRMPPEWTTLNKLVSSGGKIPVRSADAEAVIDAWHQETRDLSLILSRQTETVVKERLSRKHATNPVERRKDELANLRDNQTLSCELDIENAASPIQVTANLARRTVEVGMRMAAPGDKVSSKARLNWLLRQIKGEFDEELQIRANWPGRSDPTQSSFAALVEDPSLIENGKSGLTLTAFDVFFCRQMGARFAQLSNFISDLEDVVPEFYRAVGQNLSAWQQRPPRIREEKSEAEDVSVQAMADTDETAEGTAESS